MSIDWIPSGPTRRIRTKERGNRGIIPSSKVPEGTKCWCPGGCF